MVAQGNPTPDLPRISSAATSEQADRLHLAARHNPSREVSDMKPFIKVITLAVKDLEQSLAFYRDGIGLETEGIIGTEFEHGAVVFFQLRSGLILALWPKESLSAETNIPLSEIHPGGVTLANNVRSKAEVDDVMAQAARAGATITDPARERFFGGYSGYFRDPDGHIWEVIWNPAMDPEE
jgi:catechol 2,3-dioxygenase-like lactoylglutathione lyase family enzyme